ncbi:FAD-binding oxidoreductase [Streptomyces bambusae]|uniref:FAD-dependent oxidoreductase n=1 Tax=Streptomyces bambusae TaxID=1550616 RepID=UPI001CFD335C|nr:FAD-binding oxidoreductase [Streptomyces bambusae]MCB5165665.1 FAD-binding oxidoreductase [Streptomyces bambusae]
MTEVELPPTEQAAGQALAKLGPSVITADDPRYESLRRGSNHRFVGNLDYVAVVTTTEQVVDAVGRAVADGKRVTVRSGGHGFEGAASRDGGALLDMSEMTQVAFDPQRRAFVIEAGATLGHVYRTLFKGWNVTLPAGECTEVGVGGHFVGGGFGPLSRRLGSVVDYVCAVEVVVVDEDGTARAVVASSDPEDPHHDLWWAHTGAGGGNFGVVTRYWVRTPGATSSDPAALLPKAPGEWHTKILAWPWDAVSEKDFTRILNNVGGWFEKNSAPGSAGAQIMAFFYASHRTGGILSIGAMVDDDVEGGQEVIDDYFAAVSDGIGIEPFRNENLKPWLFFSAYPNWGDLGTPDVRRIKIKAAYLRKGYKDEQIGEVWKHLTTEGDNNPYHFILIGYGGQVNSVAPEATAIAQRDSILKAAFMGVWGNEAEDETHIGKLRAFYRDVYAETGGVPVPNDVNDGSYINYPDADLADPELNTSGVPWYTLYYKDNYPRLQAVKKAYDPRDEFHHDLSIRLPED